MNKILPVDFKVELPPLVMEHMHHALDTYAKSLVVPPMLTVGKLVVEYNTRNTGRATHVVRVLVTADFEPGRYSKSNALDTMFGKDPTLGYWESWMATLSGRSVDRGLELLCTEIYVHKEGGWQQVWVSNHPLGLAPANENGATWPELEQKEAWTDLENIGLPMLGSDG